MTEPTSRTPIPPGTLDMLILQTLARSRRLHGFDIAESIHRVSRSVLQVEEGSLYPALQRMLRRGWIRAEWRASENNRRARYYRITAEGERQLEAQRAEWAHSSRAVNRVLRFAFQGG